MRDNVPGLFLLFHFSFNPTSWSFPPYSLTLIKLRKSHLGNSSKLKRVFFLVARQRLSKLIFTLTPASVDCTRFGVGSPFSFQNYCCPVNIDNSLFDG